MPSHPRTKPVLCLTLKPENIARLTEEARKLGRSRSWLVDWILDILLDGDKNLTSTLQSLRNDDDPVTKPP